VEVGNIDLATRPIVQNEDGTISTVSSVSFEENGEHILIPTIKDDGTRMTDKEAFEEYKRTGRHLGKFSSEAKATKFAKALSKSQGERLLNELGRQEIKAGNSTSNSGDAAVDTPNNDNGNSSQ